MQPTNPTGRRLMRSRRRAVYGLALSAAVHAGLLLALSRPAVRLPAERPDGPVLRVALVRTPPVAPVASAAPDVPADLPVAEPAPDAVPPEAGARADVYYYFPHELERELAVLVDRSGDVDIALEREITLHLFVDPRGSVAGLSFEGEPPAPALEALVRAAFLTMTFRPGMRRGLAVPARIKIVIAPHAPIDTNVY